MTRQASCSADGSLCEQLLAAALWLHGLGWTVIPVRRDKRPACHWKTYQSGRRPGPKRLFEWLNREGVFGIAVIHRNGICCRDFDEPGAYERWAGEHPDLARRLPTVKTRRGYHVYFHSETAHYAKLDDGELRADPGHYSVVPPSLHPSGVRYTWIIEPAGSLPVIEHLEGAGLTAGTPIVAAALGTRDRGNSAHATLQPLPMDAPMRQCGNALMRDTEGSLEALIRSTLPTGPGQRNGQVFALVRALRRAGHDDPNPALYRLVVERWFDLAEPVITTKDFHETWEDFVHAWSNYDPAKDQALERAESAARRYVPPPIVADQGIPGLDRLACVCWALAIDQPEHRFFLACRDAARLTGLDPSTQHRTASRRLAMLCGLRIIELVTEGARHKRRANEYRWIGPPLQDGQVDQADSNAV